MKLLLLPGFEPVNQVWSIDIKKGFSSDFSSIKVVDHLEDLSGVICDEVLEKEVENLVNIVNRLGKDYVIFAKTTGALVALKAISQGLIEPKRCAFLQIPILRARVNDLQIDDWLYRYETETLFLQRKDDCEFYFNEMKEYLDRQKVENHQLIELETLDFDLTQTQKYKDFVLCYLGEVCKGRKTGPRFEANFFNIPKIE